MFDDVYLPPIARVKQLYMDWYNDVEELMSRPLKQCNSKTVDGDIVVVKNVEHTARNFHQSQMATLCKRLIVLGNSKHVYRFTQRL